MTQLLTSILAVCLLALADAPRPGGPSPAPMTPQEEQTIRRQVLAMAGVVLGGDLNAIAEQLPREDRQRVGTFQGQANEEFARLVEPVTAAWNERFKEKFDAGDSEAIFRDLRIMPLPADAEGRRRVELQVPEFRGIAAIKLILVEPEKDRPAWQVDLADAVTPAEFRAALEQQLTRLAASASAWPDDSREAARLVSHHLLTALAAK